MHIINRYKVQGTTPFLFALLTALLLTSCSLFGGSAKVGKAPADQQVYTEPLILVNGTSDLNTLDPALAYDQNSLLATSMIYTGLVSLNDQMQVQPQLATWTQGADGLTWTFHLKANLTFSDGTALTASDVAYSINRALEPATRSTVAPIYLSLIQDADKLLNGSITTLIGDSLQVVNPTTLTIITSQKAPYFLDMLAHASADVVEQKLITSYGATFTDHLNAGGGDGPFMIKQYVHRQKIVLVPNPHYEGPKPQLNQVNLPFYTQAEAAYNAYASGKVDAAQVPTSALGSSRGRPDYHQVPQLWINYYTMNYKVPPFDNIDIRKAFALAIDKTAIAKSAWQNTVTPTNHLVPQGMPGYNPELTGPDGTDSLTGNPTEAKALLKQGLRAENLSSASQLPPITLTYATGLNGSDQEVKSMVQMWQKVLGVTVLSDPVPSNTLLDEVSAATNNALGLQMWGLSWVAEYPDPQDWLTHQFAQGSIYNNMNYGQNVSTDAAEQQTVQQELASADSNTQSAARIQAYQRAEQQLVNDVAWLPIEQVSSLFLRKAYVTGIVDNGLGIIPPTDWAKIYILQH